MSKQSKQPSTCPDVQSVPSSHKKILPLKRTFITFQPDDDDDENFPDYSDQVAVIRTKNPKWCNLSLKLRSCYCKDGYTRLRHSRSLRLLSVNLEFYYFDPQAYDSVGPYSGELDSLTRASRTLKRLSLSVVRNEHFWFRRRGQDYSWVGLRRFVKRQKYLEEFGLYIGSQDEHPQWMAGLLKYVERSVKRLTIQNLSIADLFSRYEFPQLETLRLEYILFEETFDFSILEDSLPDILSLPSLQTLVISQYQRFPFDAYSEEAESEEEEEESVEEEVVENLRFRPEEGDSDVILCSEEEEVEKEEEEEEREQDDGAGQKILTGYREEDDQVEFGLKEESDKAQLDPAEEDENEEAYIERIEDDAEDEGEDEDEDRNNDDDEEEEDEHSEHTKNDAQSKQQKPKPKKTKEPSLEFWVQLRCELDNNKDIPLKIKYHRKDDSGVMKKADDFKNIFVGLPLHQSFV